MADSISSSGDVSARKGFSRLPGKWSRKLKPYGEMMPANQNFRDLFLELSGRDARFLVVGAHAVMFYTSPRYTKAIDIWIDPTHNNAGLVYAALADFGAPLHDLTLEDLSTPGVVFQIGVEPNRIDILTAIEGLSFDIAWARKAASHYDEVPIWILGKEDLVASKKAAGRIQDLLDLERLDQLDS